MEKNEFIELCEKEWLNARERFNEAENEDDKDIAKNDLEFWSQQRSDFIGQKQAEEKAENLRIKNEQDACQKEFSKEFPLISMFGSMTGLTGNILNNVYGARIAKMQIEAQAQARRETMEFTEKGLIPERNMEKFMR